MITLKNVLGSVIVVTLLLVGVKVFTYFFDTQVPEISMVGITEDLCCSGDVHCTLMSSKPGELSLWVDNKPLIQKYKIKKEHAFVLPCKTIGNGIHTIKAHIADNSYHHNKNEFLVSFEVDNLPLHATLLKSRSEYKVFQGRTLHVQFQTNKEIKEAFVQALSHSYPCFPESKKSHIYECFIPVTVEEKPYEHLFCVELVDKAGNKIKLDHTFEVVAYSFKKQVLQIDPEKIKEEETHGPGEREFEQKLVELTNKSIKEKLWQGAFCTPIDIERVTCEFGTIRTTQHKGRYHHKALDVINKPKSVVWAPQDGIVVMKEPFAVSGNTVVLDHGMGVLSLFFHLDNFAKIVVGEKLTKGNPLGTIGKSGFAKGFHLHWEMRVDNIAVDPEQWVKQTF